MATDKIYKMSFQKFITLYIAKVEKKGGLNPKLMKLSVG